MAIWRMRLSPGRSDQDETDCLQATTRFSSPSPPDAHVPTSGGLSSFLRSISHNKNPCSDDRSQPQFSFMRVKAISDCFCIRRPFDFQPNSRRQYEKASFHAVRFASHPSCGFPLPNAAARAGMRAARRGDLFFRLGIQPGRAAAGAIFHQRRRKQTDDQIHRECRRQAGCDCL